MSNIIAFYPREKLARKAGAVDPSLAIGSAATATDGAAFAHASEKGWLREDLGEIAAVLEAAVRSLGAELAAAQVGLPLPFVEGFAGHLAQSARAPNRTPLVSLQPNLTADGLEDTFYWLNQSDGIELR